MTSSTVHASGTPSPARRMQVGVAGLGAGAVQVIRAMANAPYIQLTAAADVRSEALVAFHISLPGAYLRLGGGAVPRPRGRGGVDLDTQSVPLRAHHHSGQPRQACGGGKTHGPDAG